MPTENRLRLSCVAVGSAGVPARAAQEINEFTEMCGSSGSCTRCAEKMQILSKEGETHLI